MALNAVIAIGQELPAKPSLDRLSVPICQVRRDGATVALPRAQLAGDDVLLVRAGEQLPVDGVVLDAIGPEMDEAMLTGESAPVAKSAGVTPC